MAESDEPSFGVRELGRLLDSPPSSVQRILEIGADVSLVTMSPSGRWELGWELYRLASLAQRKHPFQAATEILDELSETTGETTLLTVYDPHRKARMYVATAPGRRSVRFVPDLFKWLPLQAAASALAIIAYRPEQERRELYAAGLPIFAQGRQTGKKLESLMTSVRADGYALSHDQADVGASAVAAPIYTTGEVQSSIAVAMPNQRFDHISAADLAQHVTRAAQDLSHRLGDPLTVARGRT
ncbi:MAG: hypothetical protein M0Z30_03560 [Actinomycetota bacterium]|nr:hypothetical protein [Actinomycetota bacterium]